MSASIAPLKGIRLCRITAVWMSSVPVAIGFAKVYREGGGTCRKRAHLRKRHRNRFVCQAASQPPPEQRSSLIAKLFAATVTCAKSCRPFRVRGRPAGLVALTLWCHDAGGPSVPPLSLPEGGHTGRQMMRRIIGGPSLCAGSHCSSSRARAGDTALGRSGRPPDVKRGPLHPTSAGWRGSAAYRRPGSPRSDRKIPSCPDPGGPLRHPLHSPNEGGSGALARRSRCAYSPSVRQRPRQPPAATARVARGQAS
jgi:hypothetical protein